MREKDMGRGWISWQEQEHKECPTRVAEVALFLAIRNKDAIKLNETLETLGE